MTLSLGGIGWTGGTRQYLARGKPPPHFQRIKEKQSHELPERQSLGWQIISHTKKQPGIKRKSIGATHRSREG
jgi:hypothetical protein